MKLGPYILWGVITLAVFGWHVVWWGMISSQSLPDMRVAASSNIRYLSVPADSKDPRLKEILAPLIFSTPSIAGFSRPLLEKGAESLPPLRQVKDLAVILPRQPSAVTRGASVRSTDFLPEVKQQLKGIAFELPSVDPYADLGAPEGIVLTWRGAIDESLIDHRDVPPAWATITNRSWELSLDLMFDAAGIAQQAFVKGEEPEVIRAPVLRWARSLRTEPAEDPRWINVSICTHP